MTEPNVLGNISPAKFLFDSGNTEIINLWRQDDGGETPPAAQSFYYEDSGTENGQAYQVPVSKVFYLLFFRMWYTNGETDIALQGNTTIDTSTGGTTRARFKFPTMGTSENIDWKDDNPLCVKFVAGEYITPVGGSRDFYCTAWGVECDA